MERHRRTGQWGHRNGGPGTVTLLKPSVSWVHTLKVLSDAQPLALSLVERMSSLPHWPGPPQPQSLLVCLALELYFCLERKDMKPGICLLPAQRGPMPSIESSLVLVVDLASPLVVRPYWYSFFIHSGVYQGSRVPVFPTLSLDYCSQSLLSSSLPVSQQALLGV